MEQIQGNLKDAIRAQGGQLLEDDQYANYAVAQSLTGRDGKKITDQDIESFMESDEFIKIRNKLYGEESAEKKSPN